MTAIDVGQGDSLLVVSARWQAACWWMAAASRRSATGRRSQLDIGEDVVAPYLWDRGLRQRGRGGAFARA